jgi:hypothetical protein
LSHCWNIVVIHCSRWKHCCHGCFMLSLLSLSLRKHSCYICHCCCYGLWNIGCRLSYVRRCLISLFHVVAAMSLVVSRCHCCSHKKITLSVIAVRHCCLSRCYCCSLLHHWLSLRKHIENTRKTLRKHKKTQENIGCHCWNTRKYCCLFIGRNTVVIAISLLYAKHDWNTVVTLRKHCWKHCYY